MIFRHGVARLIELVAGININLTRLTQSALKPYDLTYPQFGALFVLFQHGECSQRELATRLDTDTTTVMVISQGLEKKGLLLRARDERDRRAYRLVLTDAGRGLFEEAYPAVEAVYAPLAQSVCESDVATALPILEKLMLHIKNTKE